ETSEVSRGIEFEIAEEDGTVTNELSLEHVAVALGPHGEGEIFCVRPQDERQRRAVRDAARRDQFLARDADSLRLEALEFLETLFGDSLPLGFSALALRGCERSD